MERKKKDNRTAVIIIVIVSAVLILLVTLFGTLCSYKSTRFLFKNQKDEYIDIPKTFDTEKALECLSALKGKNLLFLSDREISHRLSAIADVKVIDVIKTFPDTVVIYLGMRNRLFYYHDAEGGKYYVFDEELKVFSVETKRPTDAVRVAGPALSDFKCLEFNENIEMKDGLEWQAELMKLTADTLWSLGYDYGSAGGLISLFDLRNGDGGYSLVLELQTGGSFTIPEPSVNFEQRLIMLYGVFIADDAPKDGSYYVNTEGTVTLL